MHRSYRRRSPHSTREDGNVASIRVLVLSWLSTGTAEGSVSRTPNANSKESSTDGLLTRMTNEDGVWRLLQENTTQSPSIATTSPVEEVYISRATLIASFVFVSIAVIGCLLSWLFVFVNRTKRVVSVAQPFFLYLICFGSVLISLSLFTFALDESAGLTNHQLNHLCVAQMWFIFTGNIIVYMALFCKLLRVYKVMQFRRNQVIKVKYVIGPFIVVMLATLSLLIAITLVDPPQWTRSALVSTTVNEPFSGDFVADPSLMSNGICSQGNPLLVPFMSLLVLVSVVITAIMSWKTRSLPPDISDSRSVCQTLWSHCALLFMGIILGFLGLFIGEIALLTLSRVLIQFLTVVATISLMIAPKMLLVWHGSDINMGGVVRVTGLNIETPVIVASQTRSFETSAQRDLGGEHHTSAKVLACHRSAIRTEETICNFSAVSTQNEGEQMIVSTDELLDSKSDPLKEMPKPC